MSSTDECSDERKAFEVWAASEHHDLVRTQDSADVWVYDLHSTREAWEGWQAALRSQGKVVSVEKLKALQPYWCDWNDQALDEETDPEGSLKSFPTISIVYKYEDLTAIIGEGD